MKCLVIGGGRFVGLRLSRLLDQIPGIELHVMNRTGQVAHCKNAIVHKGDRARLNSSFLDKDWDLIIDFACFTEPDAKTALSFFKNVSRYVFISSASVYEAAGDRKEEDFSAEAWNLKSPGKNGDYQDGKRRAEAVFAQQSQFPVLSVRFPFIVGPDDYTHRFDFHVDRAVKGEPIFVPNPEARISLIHSADAADFLRWSIDKNLTGPLNVSSLEPISLKLIFAQIELMTGHKPILTSEETAENHSPYGVATDWYLNTDRLTKAGFVPRPIVDWIAELIGMPSAIKPKYVH